MMFLESKRALRFPPEMLRLEAMQVGPFNFGPRPPELNGVCLLHKAPASDHPLWLHSCSRFPLDAQDERQGDIPPMPSFVIRMGEKDERGQLVLPYKRSGTESAPVFSEIALNHNPTPDTSYIVTANR